MTTPPIVPRWEWRTFGERFGDADARFAGLTPGRVDESDEIYLLSLASDASVKIRDGLMDVKRLERRDDDGLELWKPVMKASYPLPAPDVAAVITALGVAVPPLPRAEYTLDELITEVVGPRDDLMAVEVHKRREHYTVGGCLAELSEVGTAQGSRRTIAIESEDPARVIATVRELGLGSRRNVSMAHGLKAIVGLGARRYAVIDVGTNSVKFHVGERDEDGEWRTVVDRADVTRLGEGLTETGRLEPEPMERTVRGNRRDGRRGQAGRRRGDRSGRNRRPASRVQQRGLARSRARTQRRRDRGHLGRRRGPLCLSRCDLGAGNRQRFAGRVRLGRRQHPVHVRARRARRRAVQPERRRRTPRRALRARRNRLRRDARRRARRDRGRVLPLDGRPVPEILVGMGGTVTNLTAVKHGLATYDPDVVQGTVLDRMEVDRQIELYRTRTVEERREIAGLQPGRAEVILAGACIVRTVLDKLACPALTVSDRGLRHGLLVARFG